MPKSAADATRFTSTTPHASAKPPAAAASTIPKRTPGPPGETPQQKVARLREAAARTRNANVSIFDKVVLRGRVWADRAHRFTALSLIAITGISGAVTVYALGDMMIYNRRKRREYFAEQQAIRQASVFEAEQALRRGVATEEQRVLVEEETRSRQVEEAKNVARSPGIFARSKAWLFSGMEKEEVRERHFTSDHRDGDESSRLGSDTAEERESPILRAVEEREREVRGNMNTTTGGELGPERTGGPLDRLGTGMETGGTSIGDPPKQGGGWTSFMTRR